MKITSAEANKLIKKLEDNKAKLLLTEREDYIYNAAVGEDHTKLKPDYSLIDTQEAYNNICKQIINLKHALNAFNLTTEVKDGMTIDQVLVLLPMLNSRKEKLNQMRLLPSMKRDRIIGNVIDYQYTSYDPQDAQDLYEEISDKITSLQLALDKINMTVEFEV